MGALPPVPTGEITAADEAIARDGVALTLNQRLPYLDARVPIITRSCR